MLNVNKLKGKMVECGMNATAVAQAMGVDKATLYRRMCNNGKQFTIAEVESLVKILHLTREDINTIFFAEDVAYDATQESNNG